MAIISEVRSMFLTVGRTFYYELLPGASIILRARGQEILGIRQLDSGCVSPGSLLSFSGFPFSLLYSNSLYLSFLTVFLGASVQTEGD